MHQKEQIFHILSAFDFEKVHSTLTFLNQTWTLENGVKRVPTKEELETIGESCLNKVADSPEKSVIFAANGFQAQKIDNSLGLYFMLESVHPLYPILNNEHGLARKKK